MTIEHELALSTNAEYVRDQIIEGHVPRTAHCIIDIDGNIRKATLVEENLGYAESLFLGKPAGYLANLGFLDSSLQMLAYRIACQCTESEAAKQDLERIRASFGVKKNQDFFEDLVKKLIESGEQKLETSNDGRIRKKSGVIVPRREHFWLYLKPDKTYAGALVALEDPRRFYDPSRYIESSLQEYALNPRKDFLYSFGPILKKTELKQALNAVDRFKVKFERIVFDFLETVEFDEDPLHGLLYFVSDAAKSGKFVIGNPGIVQSSAEKYFKGEKIKNVPVRTLVIPEIKANGKTITHFSQLEKHIEEALKGEQPFMIDDNNISEKSVPEVQPNTERKSDDIRPSGESP